MLKLIDSILSISITLCEVRRCGETRPHGPYLLIFLVHYFIYLIKHNRNNSTIEYLWLHEKN